MLTYGYDVAPDMSFEDSGKCWVIRDANGLTVAATRDERIANLMIAAPEMLAALKAFVEPWSAGGNWEQKINYDTYHRARAAIAKAGG